MNEHVWPYLKYWCSLCTLPGVPVALNRHVLHATAVMRPLDYPEVVAEPLALAAALLEWDPAPAAHRMRQLAQPHLPDEPDEPPVGRRRAPLAHVC